LVRTATGERKGYMLDVDDRTVAPVSACDPPHSSIG